jgi:hypothetical protein
VGSRRPRFHPEAEADLEAAGERYDEIQRGLGLKFVRAVRAVRAKANDIAEAPQRWPVVRGKQRALLRTFPSSSSIA